MKPILLAFIALCTLACHRTSPENGYIAILEGKTWENQDLDFVAFDADTLYLLIKENFDSPLAYQFEWNDEMLTVANKTINAYNILDFKDSVSLLKFEYLTPDSFKIVLLNSAEIFERATSLTFYNTESVDRFSYYQEKDTARKVEIDSALRHIQNNKYVAFQYYPTEFRNKKEFIQLLQENGITYFDMGPPPCMPTPRNGYQETMDYYLHKKFGEQYFDNFLARADSVMLKHSQGRIFKYYECDVEPQIEGKIYMSSSMDVETNLPIKEDRQDWKTTFNENMFAVYYPFIDLEFQVDTLGQLSDFHISSFNPQLTWNKQFKKQLFALAVKEVKAVGKWVPGSIIGQKVNVHHVVRVAFK
jgi:hypothetical protein